MFSLETTAIAQCSQNNEYVDGKCDPNGTGATAPRNVPCLKSWFGSDGVTPLPCNSSESGSATCGIANYFGYWDLCNKTGQANENDSTFIQFIRECNSKKYALAKEGQWSFKSRDGEDKTVGMTNIAIYDCAFFPRIWIENALDYLKKYFDDDKKATGWTAQYAEFGSSDNPLVKPNISWKTFKGPDDPYWPGKKNSRPFSPKE